MEFKKLPKYANNDKLNSKVGKTLTHDELMKMINKNNKEEVTT